MFCCATQPGAPLPTLRQQVLASVASTLHLDRSDLADNLRVLRQPFLLSDRAHLRVVSIKPAGESLWFLRLDCDSRHDCLPFYALLRSTGINPPILRRLSTNPDSQMRADVAKRDRQSTPALLEHSGDRVEVIEELSGMQLKTRAVCLQSGSLGDRIRVRTLATHRVLLATVAGDKLVRVER